MPSERGAESVDGRFDLRDVVEPALARALVLAAEAGRWAAPLPDGVAFRLKKGDGIMLNVHYLNTGHKVIDGNAVVDVKFADVDPDRLIAAMFNNLNVGFTLPPSANTTSDSECVAGKDMKLLMMSNHMHEFGTSALTQVIRAVRGRPRG